jgi:catalase
MMEGFGVHTFRLVDKDGATSLVKFHWKPRLGVHSLLWEEAQMLAGMDPDFHRRDLADAIESGAFPQWELGVQVFEDTPEQTFAGIDLLDPTKLVPEEEAPVVPIGLLTLTANPTNYFAETEQVAFHVGNLVPGVDVTDDRLMQARLFSYVDTQLTRLGGPNFAQIPINRAHAPVNDMLRDGFHQDAVHGGVAPYRPNSLDGGCPFHAAGGRDGAFVDVPVTVAEGPKTREVPASFDDHFSQARQFWLSMSETEQNHIVSAYTFELAKCYEQTIKERQVAALANIDPDLCARVASALGLSTPEPSIRLKDQSASPALSQIGGAWPLDGRVLGIVVDADAANSGLAALTDAVRQAGMVPLIVASRGGSLADGSTVQRSLDATRSIEYDAVLLSDDLDPDPRVDLLVAECFRHGKAIGVWGEDAQVLASAGVSSDSAGIVTGLDADALLGQLTDSMAEHRVWERLA